MNKSLRRMAIAFATICVLMIMAVPAFADAGNGYYVVGDRTIPTYAESDTIKVKVVIQSRQYSSSNSTSIAKIVSVPLTGSTAYTVRDVLLKYNTLYSSTGVLACDNDGNAMSSTADVVHAFSNSTGIYKYLLFANIGNGQGRIPIDGWMFKVNGQNPLLSLTGYNGGHEGAYIYDTPVADGDVVTVFFNCPFTISNTDLSTKFIAADSSYSNGTLEVQLKYTRDNHYDTNGQWTNTVYASYGPGLSYSGTIYDSSLSVVDTITLSSTGAGTKSISLDPGTYYLYVPGVRTWKTLSGYKSFSGSTTVSCKCLNSTFVFDRIVVE